jgi:predicted nucleic acid-binding protein
VAVRLLDTNIVSFILKGHTLAARYQPHLTGHTLAISFMTVAELLEGALTAGWGPRRMAILTATISGLLILHSDASVCQHWAEVRAARQSQPISVADAWIAATALAHGIELVTHNPSDFAGIPGLTVITEAP